MAKLPAMQFYPGDWKKDIGVQSLSLHDRALWFEMMLLMHDSEQRGRLVLNGKPMTHPMIARAVGLDIQIFEEGLTHILEFGVASLDADTGAICCRRMIRDEKVRVAHTEAGKKGGNPALVNQKSTLAVIQIPTPSSSTSTSITDLNTIARFTSSEVESIYQAYPRKIGRGDAVKAIKKALQSIDDETPVKSLLAIVRSYARSPAGNNGSFTPHPATWFNAKRYLDDPGEWERVR